MLIFPALVTAGMSLMDTIDSTLMTSACGWAFVKPMRKRWYNLTITAASVVVANFLGGLEALGLIRDKLDFNGRLWSAVGNLSNDLTNFEFVVVGVFIVTWLISALIYGMKGYDRVSVEPGR